MLEKQIKDESDFPSSSLKKTLHKIACPFYSVYERVVDQLWSIKYYFVKATKL
jgi:hypothetical protein